MLDSLGIGVVLFDLDGKVKFANPEANDILGLSTDEIERRGNDTIKWHVVDESGEPVPQDETAFVEVLRTLQPVNRIIGLKQDNGILWLRLVGYPYYDYDNKLTGIVMAFLRRI